MFKKIINTYYKLLDKKLENGTIMVLVVVALIISASLITKDVNALLYTKSNILETNKQVISSNNILIINGIKYKVILKEIKD